MASSAPTLSNTFLPRGRPQSESQASWSLVASTAEARLSSWPFSLSRISSAMALWVCFSSFSSFLATSLLRSQSGFRGARLARSTSSMTGLGLAASSCSLTFSSTATGLAWGTLLLFRSSSSSSGT
uniref:Uncharacterized protein n=1 Tax=Myotis myotis TaxID=51298 RepID=A0A7J7VZ11_MYOMY|nr:hypothetical protein mMyoMyo1_012339 [Myotis myotis]